jgi:putative membrane protein
MSVNRLLNLEYALLIEIVFWSVALLTLVIGIYKYRKQKQSLKNSEMHIGDYKLDWKK